MIKPVLFRSNHLYIFGLILLVSGLPLSLFVTSISQFILGASFFLEGNLNEKLRRYFRNKPALILTGILVLHFIGLLWTTDIAEGVKDIRIKSPLFILPFIIAGTEPLSKKQFQIVMGFFIAAVFAGTLISMAVLTGIIHREITDIRDIFIFHISHIRFALFICVVIFSLLFFLLSGSYVKSVYLKIVYAALIVWLLVFLVIMESVTGILITVVVGFLLLLRQAFVRQNKLIKVVFIIIAFLVPSSIFFFAQTVSKQYYEKKDVPIDMNSVTSEGHPYTFSTTEQQRENGYLIWVYVCESEMKQEWNARSTFRYDSVDIREQPVSHTLLRFLTSKGWRKDGEAVRRLSDGEVHSIEKGIANVNYEDVSSIKARALMIVWEYDQFMHSGDVNGHSVMQRLEFWRAAVGIIHEHPLIGVGTGDMPAAYKQEYDKMNSTLSPEWRFRAHNQFLAIAVAFGLFALTYFIFALFYPLFYRKKYNDYFYFIFWMIAVLSMFTEDTLETQTGVTFFAFFSSLFLFGRNDSVESDKKAV